MAGAEVMRDAADLVEVAAATREAAAMPAEAVVAIVEDAISAATHSWIRLERSDRTGGSRSHGF